MSTETLEDRRDRRMAAKVQQYAAHSGFVSALHEQAAASNADFMSVFASCARTVAQEIRDGRLEPRPAKN